MDPYGYSRYYRDQVWQEPDSREAGSRIQTLLSIRDSLRALAGTCGDCLNTDGSRCTVQMRGVNPGDPACDDFLRREPRPSGEDRSKAQLQALVNQLLGVKDPALAKRLTGQG